MNGDKKRVQFTDGESNIHFRRKTEALDWKKVASIDVDKVAQSSNLEILRELLSQVAYCRAETEFDSERTDSGLLKVFKLSQLIIEYLLHSHEHLQQNYDKTFSQLSQAEEQKIAFTKEIQSLKDNLQAAKRELKRRKEIIASAQSEVIGDNKDEFDPCPYCSKKFLTSAYLISHMQRRHQGLPIHPVFPAPTSIHSVHPPPPQNVNMFHAFPSSSKFLEPNSNEFSSKQYAGNSPHSHSPRQKSGSNSHNQNHNSKYVIHCQAHDTHIQAHHHKVEVDKLINLETIGQLVDQFLQEKGREKEKEMLKNQREEIPNDGHGDNHHKHKRKENEDIKHMDKGDEKTTIPIVEKNVQKFDATDAVAKLSEEIKTQMDLQWKNLLHKIQETSLGELSKSLISEPGEIESKSTTSSPGKTRRKSKDTIVPIHNVKASKSTGTSIGSDEEVDHEGENESEQEGEREQGDRRKEKSKITPETKIILEPVVSPIIHINNNVEERLQRQNIVLQRQQNELDSLKSNLQSRMIEDKLNIESKLESQERYWQNKLRMVEKKYLEEYSGQLSKLRDEFNQSLQKLVEKKEAQSVEHSEPRVESKSIVQDQNDKLCSGNNIVESVQQNVINDNDQDDNHDDDDFNVEVDVASSATAPSTNINHHITAKMSQSNSPPPPFQSPKAISNSHLNHATQQNTLVNQKQQQQQQHQPQQKQQKEGSPSSKSHLEKPVAKPRKIPTALPTASSSAQPQAVPLLPVQHPTVDKKNSQNVIQVKPHRLDHHEYEEPQDVVKLDKVMDYSQSESASGSGSGSESGSDTDVNEEEGDEEEDRVQMRRHEHESSASGDTDEKSSIKPKRIITPHRIRRQRINLNNYSGDGSKVSFRMLTEEQAALEKRQRMREQCEKELTDQLKSLGYEPEGTEQTMRPKDKYKILKKLKRQRESINKGDEVKYSTLRERIQKEAELSSLTKSIQDKLDNSKYVSPSKKTSKSPLVKILSAVKMSGTIKKVRAACKRPPKEKKSPAAIKISSPPPQPPAIKIKSPSKPSLFSRARWRRQKKKRDGKEAKASSQNQHGSQGDVSVKGNNESNNSNCGEGESESQEDEDGENNTEENENTTHDDESKSSEPEVEKTIFISKKPLMTSTPSSNKVQYNAPHAQRKESQKSQSHRSGQNETEGVDDSSSEFETDDDDDDDIDVLQQQQSKSPKTNKLKVKNNKASKLRYREAARKNAAIISGEKEREKLLMQQQQQQQQAHSTTTNAFSPKGFAIANPGYGNVMTSSKKSASSSPSVKAKEYNAPVRDDNGKKSRSSSVRRSLEPQLGQATPQNHHKAIKVTTADLHSFNNSAADDNVNHKGKDKGKSSVTRSKSHKMEPNDSFNSDSDSSDEGKDSDAALSVSSSPSSSSWYISNKKDKELQLPQDKSAGEYVSLSPKNKKYTNSNNNNNNSNKISSPKKQKQLSRSPQNKLSIRPSTAGVVSHNNANTTNTIQRPQTSKRATRVALDSWDDDLSDGEGEIRADNRQRESSSPNNKKPVASPGGGGGLVSQRWETFNHLLYNSNSGEMRRRPMPVQTNDVIKLSPSHSSKKNDTNTNKAATARERDSRRDSPLNNSWDSD